MKKTKNSKNEKIFGTVNIILIAILSILIIVYAVKTYNDYVIFKEHQNYFKQPNQTIQSWMTIQTIKAKYNISDELIQKELQINSTRNENKLTILDVCEKNRLNCSEVLNRLNEGKK